MVLLKRRCLRLVVGGDPVNEGCNPGVHAWIARKSAALTPANNTVLNSVSASASEKRATAVTLAGINSTIGNVPSANHGIFINVQVTVGSLAVSDGDNGNIDLKKSVGDGASRASSSPSGNCGDGASRWVETSRGQLHWGNPLIVGQRLVQKDQTDVVVGSDGSVVLVHGVRDDISVLFVSGDDVEVILTGHDAELVNSDTANTMGSVQDSFWAENGSTA